MPERASTIAQPRPAWPQVRHATGGRARRWVVSVFIAVLLTDVGILAAAEPPGDQSCAHATAGQTCERHGRRGTCQQGECCRLDYAARKGTAPPPSVCKPCLTCNVPPPKLESLVLPHDDTPAVAPPVDATPTQPVDVTATQAPPALASAATSVEAAAPRPPNPPDGGIDARWAWLAVPVALAVWFLVRRRAGGQP